MQVCKKRLQLEGQRGQQPVCIPQSVVGSGSVMLRGLFSGRSVQKVTI